MTQSVGMAEIARRCGCSTGTVSRVLNGGRVAVATRDRVLAVMRETGYQPKFLANRGRRILLAGCPFTTSRGAYHAAVMAGMSAAAASRGVQFLLVEEPGRDLEGLWLEHRADALITFGGDARALVELAASGRVVMRIGSWDDEPTGVLLAGNDAAASGRLSATTFLSAGHRRLALVVSAGHSPATRDFIAAWSAAVDEAGAEIDILPVGGVDGVAHAMLRLNDRRRRPTALALERPHYLLPCLQCCWRFGWSVPDDLSLLAREDAAVAPYAIPPITTVGFDNRALGAAVMHRVVDALDGHPVTGHYLQPAVVQERSSIRFMEDER